MQSLLLICLPLVALMVKQVAVAEVFLWPQPRSIAWGSGLPIFLSDSFHFRLPAESPQELLLAASRYRDLIFREKWVPVAVSTNTQTTLISDGMPLELSYLTVSVADLHTDLQQGVKEGYTLMIPDGGGSNAYLKADTVWGALHGFETFSQLVQWDKVAEKIVLERGVTLSDAPLYGYRGIMLDVARNFYPIPDLMRTVRAMAHNKLNVLHLHLTDSQSFPLEIASEPELASKGTFGPQFIYYASDIQRLVSYARYYGVRIVPEIDNPGHSGSWAGAYPDLVTCYNKFWLPDMAVEPAPGQLNPLKNETYRVFKNVINDVASAFPDQLFHGGKDEPIAGCWESSPDIAEYLKQGNNTLSTLLEKFVRLTHPYITSNNKTAIYWEDILLSDDIHVSSSLLPPETTILETWNEGPLNTKRLTAAGYRTIVASANFYYLDCGRGSFVGNDTHVDQQVNPTPGTCSYNYGGSGGSWCAPYKTWQRIYDYDITYNLTMEEAGLVMGGEVCLWSEQADETVLDGLLWPRASALAESLWSGNRDGEGERRSVDALYRLNDWRYHMVSRGIKAMPIQPLWCLKHPGECNLALGY
ncbi:hypothetical protein GOP47_0006256 [Adiantum capillus-veneris]|uniref:Beta-hexosaminidase n=1 Tax=Adiantum capillus-veneris TaxID=13818 RepID=A0A9D4V2I2_ADICA|nr:hypothetical protein GOP47_0006256 [Adiantum capillus-veneris]